jgi:cullin-4
MFKDIELSQNLMQDFAEQHAEAIERSGVQLIVHNLTSPMWPSPSNSKVVLPLNLTSLTDCYTEFYSSLHRGKKLNWQTSMSHCILKAILGGVRKELNVSLHQAAVLLFFNHAESMSFLEIMAATGLSKPEIKRELTSLSCKKYRILAKTSDPKKVTSTDVFSVNDKFKHRLTRFTISTLHVKEAVRPT